MSNYSPADILLLLIALYLKLLPTGETSLILKHSEGYFAAYDVMKIEVERSGFEYEALVALASSGLFDSNSTVQVPKPIYFDRETYTIFMTDLGSVDTLSKVLAESLEGVHAGEHAQLKLKDAYALASEVGSALGDFVGRFHNWGALPEQATLRQRFSQNVAGKEQCFSLHFDTAIRSATTFGVKESWMEDIIGEEKREAAIGGNVLAIGDLWLDNILVSRTPEDGGLRLYVIDWEMARPARPEFDMGELTGTMTSFARRYSVHDVYPFIPSLHQAYHRHRTLDPLRIARATGMDAMGFGTVLPWAREQGDDFLQGVTLAGFGLLQLSHNSDAEAIMTKSVLKSLFNVEPQQMI